ncbi:TonB-dependent receptor [Aquabacterium sp. OR-4]|uniref:TonB-dependent receptor n=1 Tax=Aquabacterium sp. OR-4 TaxID=2978127 RepID=UPI0028C9261A|nr:TonB-dependent receptor [Aquabacterium sp. OR-4]MDT7837067.1 TonB-dependent receptor [Aquabacterium sp. OR-4]
MPPSCTAHPGRPPLHLIALACLAAATGSSHAQGVATDAQVQPLVITGTRAALDPNLPSSTASITAEDLREQNLFNPEDAARMLPSTAIRKRYLGDRNANVGGRSHGVLQPGRALVYVDGYLISNFLGRFDAPRWNMVNLEALERVDALYGPFSAIYPGNSIGTTLVMTERKPRGFEASASLRLSQQDFQEYASAETYLAGQASARLAMRHDNGLFWVLGLQHQDSQGHPMGYANAVRGSTSGAFATPAAQTRVSGIVYDTDPNGRERALFGATGIDHSVQDTLNARGGWALSPTQEVEARVSLWRSRSDLRYDTWLRDEAGKPVWLGSVRDDRYAFSLPASSFAPSTRLEAHRQLGATWKTTHATGWNASVVATQYRIVEDASRQANLSQPEADLGGAGSVTRRDGTGWTTLELQATYRPVAGDWGQGRHAPTVGLHRNEYTLKNIVNTASDWRSTETALDQSYFGRTRITALYAQDAWRLNDDWRLTAGLRQERFETWGGAQYFAGPPVAQNTYAARRIDASSPKLALAWAASDTLLLKASAAKGVRFPNVDELYNGTKTGTSITTSDPALRPERARALELSAELDLGRQNLRASLFRDDVRDTIVRQTDSTVTPSVTRVNNIDRVLTEGLELVWDARDLGHRGLDLGANATWAQARIEANAANPASVGKRWLRVPPQRYTAQLAWRGTPGWLFAAAWRWSGRQFNTDTNIDIHPDTYGGTSRVNQLDLKASWRFAPQWEWSLGIDNAGNHHAWQAHTLPQRVLHTALRWEMR